MTDNSKRFSQEINHYVETLRVLDFDVDREENVAYCKKCPWSCDAYNDCIEHAWVKHGVMVEGVKQLGESV